MNGEIYENQARQIIRSSESYFPTTAKWYNRDTTTGPYDPVICLYEYPN